MERRTLAAEVRALYACIGGTTFTLPLRLHGSTRPPQPVRLRVVEVYVPHRDKHGQIPEGGPKRVVLVELVGGSARYVLKSIVDKNGTSEIPSEAAICTRVEECIRARNAVAAAGAAHWDSIKMVDVFRSGNAHFMMQSVFVGLPLYKTVSLSHQSPWLLRDVLVRVSEMLQHLQMKMRFIHRDFHCANVLVAQPTTGALRVCLIDFGMSLIQEPGSPTYVGNPDARIGPAYSRDQPHHNAVYNRECLYRGRASLDLMCLCVSLLPELYTLSDFASRRLARMCTHAMKTLKPALRVEFWDHLRNAEAARRAAWKQAAEAARLAGRRQPPPLSPAPQVTWLMCYAHAACTSMRVFEPAVFSHLLRAPQQLYIERPVVGGVAVGVEDGEIAMNNVLNLAEFLTQTPLTRQRFALDRNPGADDAWNALRRPGGALVDVPLPTGSTTATALYELLARKAHKRGCSVVVGYLDAQTSIRDKKVLIALTEDLPSIPGAVAGLYCLRIEPVANTPRIYDDPARPKHGVQTRYEFGDLWRHGLAHLCTWSAVPRGTLTVAYAAYAGSVASDGGSDGLRLAPHTRCHEDDDDLACLSRIPATDSTRNYYANGGARLVNRMLRFVRTNCTTGFTTHRRKDAANHCFSLSYTVSGRVPITHIARIPGVVGVVRWSTDERSYGFGAECVFADDYDRILRIAAADTDASLRMEDMILSHQGETDLDNADNSKIEVVHRESRDEGRIHHAVFRLIYGRSPPDTAAVVEVEDDDDVVFVRVDPPPPPPPARARRPRTSWTGPDPTESEGEDEKLYEERLQARARGF